MRALLVALAACGGATHPAPPGQPPALADCAWLAGTWHAPELDAHWQLVDGALYGIALDVHGGFEVNIVDDSDEDGHPAPITLTSIQDGHDVTRFALRSATSHELEFADPQHGVVRVTKTAAGWRGELAAPGQPVVGFDMQPGRLEGGDPLIAADVAFDADTAARGGDGWMDHFDDRGAMWRAGARVERAAMHDAVAKTLARGSLRWKPAVGGARGDLGFTLGTYTYRDHHGSYATIWKHQPDGSWKVVFDIGRPG